MKQTQEQIDAITEYFHSQFWPLYPSDLTHGKKGPKSVALRYMLKKNPDEKLMQDIINKLRVLISSGRAEKRCGKDPDRLPFASTWINQERWNDVEDMAMPSTIKDTRQCECGSPVVLHGQCDECYDRDHPDMCLFPKTYLYNEGLVKNGLGINEFKNKEEWHQACMNRSIPRLRRALEASRRGDRSATVHTS